MIEVTSALVSEERDRDVSRNRLLLTLGKKQFRLDRDEAVKLANDLTAALEQTKEQTIQGTIAIDGRSISVKTAQGDVIKAKCLDYSILQNDGVSATFAGAFVDDTFQIFSFETN